MNKYKVEVVFAPNEERKGEQLEFLITVTTNYAFRQDKLFVAELFKEIAYGSQTESLMPTNDSYDHITYFNQFLLDHLFDNDSYTLSLEMMKEFEIEKVVVFSPFGEEMVRYSMAKEGVE